MIRQVKKCLENTSDTWASLQLRQDDRCVHVVSGVHLQRTAGCSAFCIWNCWRSILKSSRWTFFIQNPNPATQNPLGGELPCQLPRSQVFCWVSYFLSQRCPVPCWDATSFFSKQWFSVIQVVKIPQIMCFYPNHVGFECGRDSCLLGKNMQNNNNKAIFVLSCIKKCRKLVLLHSSRARKDMKTPETTTTRRTNCSHLQKSCENSGWHIGSNYNVYLSE